VRSIFAACLIGLALAPGILGEEVKNDRPTPVARITAGRDLVATEGQFKVTVAGDVKREPAKVGGGEVLAFGADGQLTWNATNLLNRDCGSIAMEIAAGGDKQALLIVTDERKNAVLNLGRLSASRGDWKYSIPGYLNENEEGWLRTVLTWERLDDERMYVRVTVNDRTYERAIAPAFPTGELNFTFSPKKAQVREIAFYSTPLPKQPHPHITRTPAATPAEEMLRRQARISESEQDALDAKGGVVVLVPDGAQTHGLLSGLRTMGLLRFRVIRNGDLAGALTRAAILILPDNDYWAPDAARDAAIRDYVQGGGGLLALGTSALEVRRMGLIEFDPREAGMEGRTHAEIRGSALRTTVPASILPDSASFEMRARRGPLFAVPPKRKGEIAAVNGLTKRANVVVSESGNGRVVVASVYPFSYYFCHPVYENCWNLTRNAQPYVFFKALLFHAAGVPFTATAPEDRLQEAVAMPVIESRKTGGAGIGGDQPFGEPGISTPTAFTAMQFSSEGAISFYINADTLHLEGAEPRSLLFASDGSDNSVHLFYDPRDQFLVLSALTPNEEYTVMVNERTTWDGKEWRHIGVTWRGTSLGDMAVELSIDGQVVATGGLPLPTRILTNVTLGAIPGMKEMPCTIRGFVILSEPRLDLAAIRAQAAPPICFDDTPEELAYLDAFLKTHRLAFIGRDQSATTRGTNDIWGVKFDVLNDRDFAEEALSEDGYSLVFVPGGNQPEFKPDPKGYRDQIRDFVKNGGGFMGICAGLFEGSSHQPPNGSSNLFKTGLAPFGGCELVDITLDSSHPIMRGINPAYTTPARSVRFMHMSGPGLIVKAEGADLKPIVWLGIAPDYAGAGSFNYGKGRGVVWCPHPEQRTWSWWRPSDRTQQVMRRLFRNSVYYAAGEEPWAPAR
jgi:hypothetical protein